MATQVQEIKNMAIKLKSLGYPLSEEFQTIAILTALPSKWNTIHDIIPGKFSLQATIDALLEHEMVLKHDQENALVSSQSYFSQIPTQRVLKDRCAQIARDLVILWTNVGPRVEEWKERD